MEFNNDPVCIKDLEKLAMKVMPGDAWGYYDSGANGEQTKRDNEASFSEYRLHPRMLRDVSQISTETTILGQKVKTPLGVAPCAMHKLAHPEGEAATSRAAVKNGSIMILSTYSTTSLEKVIAQGNGDTQYWMQLYVYQNRSVSEKLVRRAEKAGFKALVLTVDAPVLGRRLVDARNKFNPPPHLRLENFMEPEVVNDPAGYSSGLAQSTSETFGATFGANGDQSLSWANGISWLKSITSMPIIVKGILTAEDTRLAIEHGCAGVIVSNHGGRQLDGALATIDALPQVVEAAENKIEVYLDGGVRRGSDIFKALALGARAVFVARPVLWGLAYKGEHGAHLALDLLQKELELTMTLSGTTKVSEIDESYVYKPVNRWVRYAPGMNGNPKRLLAKL
ncbi:hydroxyacid oxidase 1-like protein [Coemansia reversa NRRL 1564]|uniref:Oxidase FUB9 n=1 Tax=Coemansia reversa (strain ATCC 12441 / NRRL 1564) TaxID=763665 RepID=A0A2G5B3Q9_COERN|nr:hydroxyacid oxidase 1-like protein [Coemansia reversa NRRL 1564]|eukprot:PIA13649.1 hydroxyacid oxidase 1-like protein [Coemansia reversa NRRL 1564]